MRTFSFCFLSIWGMIIPPTWKMCINEGKSSTHLGLYLWPRFLLWLHKPLSEIFSSVQKLLIVRSDKPVMSNREVQSCAQLLSPVLHLRQQQSLAASDIFFVSKNISLQFNFPFCMHVALRTSQIPCEKKDWEVDGVKHMMACLKQVRLRTLCISQDKSLLSIKLNIQLPVPRCRFYWQVWPSLVRDRGSNL